LFILDSTRYARDTSIAGKLDEIIEGHGGEVLVSRLWDERRLAYPIEGHRKGTYWLLYFKIDSQQLPLINRQFQLNDDVLRMLFVKLHPRLVDAIVSHAAQGGLASTSTDAAAEASSAEASTGEVEKVI
jgi:small subunit ribosomal protein S6